ncbi:MAG: creatininase family protein [Desulfobacterales bacterium]|nr:MAG: creatininase family protein [Desulfobacterales bacterium]
MKEAILYAHLSWPEIRDLKKDNIVVVQPFGAIEDHGPHLPVETDCLLINAISLAAVRKVEKNVLLMPLIPYGYVEHHMDFPGPISIAGHHLVEYLAGALKSLARHGFRRLLVANGHGSNRPFMDVAARMTMDETDAIIGCVTPYSLARNEIKDICESKFLSHAEELETSLVLYLDETLVDMSKRVKEIGFPISKFHWRSLIDPPPLSFVDRWSRISETGVVGDATVASKEKGERLFKVIVDRMAELIEEFKYREIKTDIDHH